MGTTGQPPQDGPNETSNTQRPLLPRVLPPALRAILMALAMAAVLVSLPFAFGFVTWQMFGQSSLWQEVLPKHVPWTTFVIVASLALQYLAFSLLAGRTGLRGLLSRIGLLAGGIILVFAIVLLANLNWSPDAFQVSFSVDGESYRAKLVSALAALVFSLGTVSIALSRQPWSLGRRLRAAILVALLISVVTAGVLFQIMVSETIHYDGAVDVILNSALSLAIGTYLILSVAEVFVGDYGALKSSGRHNRGKLRAGLFTALHAGLLLTGALVGFSMAIGGRNLATLPGSIIIRDASGQILQYTSISQEARTYRLKVRLDQVPDFLAKAVVSVEDRTFLTAHHRPVDPIRLASSVLNSADQVTSQGAITRLEGGSTISQQVVKLHTGRVLSSRAADLVAGLPDLIGRPIYLIAVLLDKTLIEMPAACVVETLWSKEEILQYYLNAVYLGEGVYGVETASQIYFGKRAVDLTPGEASLLAGLIQAPSALDPRVNMAAARLRQNVVLSAMVRSGHISYDEADAIWAEPPRLIAENPFQPFKAPHFCLVVETELSRRLGTRAYQGAQVTTTLDPSLQRLATTVATNGVAAFATRNANNAALVAIEPQTGFVKALVGSTKPWTDPIDGQYNMVLAERPAASTFKLFVYIAAYEHGYSPDDVIDDRQRAIAGQFVHNWDGQDSGSITLREAFAGSRNPPAVELTVRLGPKTVADVAHRMGVKSDLQENDLGPLIGLGACSVRPLDMATAYGAIATGGVKREPVFILSVQDWKGDQIYEHKPPPETRVISQQTAQAIESSLRILPAKDGFSTRMGAKTGTSDNFTDSWFVGYTSDLAVATWMGNTGSKRTLEPMDNVWGYDGAGSIWRGFMAARLGEKPRPGVPCAAY